MTKRESMTAKNDEALQALLADTRKELREQRFSAVGARAKDSNAPRKLRKVIARVLTEQHARGTSAAASASSGSRPTTA